MKLLILSQVTRYLDFKATPRPAFLHTSIRPRYDLSHRACPFDSLAPPAMAILRPSRASIASPSLPVLSIARPPSRAHAVPRVSTHAPTRKRPLAGPHALRHSPVDSLTHSLATLGPRCVPACCALVLLSAASPGQMVEGSFVFKGSYKTIDKVPATPQEAAKTSLMGFFQKRKLKVGRPRPECLLARGLFAGRAPSAPLHRSAARRPRAPESSLGFSVPVSVCLRLPGS